MAEDQSYTQLLIRKEWLRELAPTIPDAVCDQLATLHPLEVIPKEDGVYVRRIASAAASFMDLDTSISYCVAVWPGIGSERKLRLYVTLPAGPIFLMERSMQEALKFLHLQPPLPRYVTRAAEEYIRRYIPLPEPA